VNRSPVSDVLLNEEAPDAAIDNSPQEEYHASVQHSKREGAHEMFGIGHGPEIIILLVIVLLVFGPGKLPEIGSAFGRGIREFKDATNGLHDSSPNQQTLQQPQQSRAIQQPPVVEQQWTAQASETREPVSADHSRD
jgi:TatA/E family protein of Tat protein translocase